MGPTFANLHSILLADAFTVLVLGSQVKRCSKGRMVRKYQVRKNKRRGSSSCNGASHCAPESLVRRSHKIPAVKRNLPMPDDVIPCTPKSSHTWQNFMQPETSSLEKQDKKALSDCFCNPIATPHYFSMPVFSLILRSCKQKLSNSRIEVLYVMSTCPVVPVKDGAQRSVLF
jgi:hypothetical protein